MIAVNLHTVVFLFKDSNITGNI